LSPAQAFRRLDHYLRAYQVRQNNITLRGAYSAAKEVQASLVRAVGGPLPQLEVKTDFASNPIASGEPGSVGDPLAYHARVIAKGLEANLSYGPGVEEASQLATDTVAALEKVATHFHGIDLSATTTGPELI